MSKYAAVLFFVCFFLFNVRGSSTTYGSPFLERSRVFPHSLYFSYRICSASLLYITLEGAVSWDLQKLRMGQQQFLLERGVEGRGKEPPLPRPFPSIWEGKYSSKMLYDGIRNTSQQSYYIHPSLSLCDVRAPTTHVSGPEPCSKGGRAE